MRIERNNIAFAITRSKLIRARRTKMKSSTRNISWASQSTKTSSLARTLAQKKALAAKSSAKTTSTSQTMLDETKKNYTSMETAAENAMKHLQKLLNTGESSLWGSEETEPGRAQIQEEITEFVEYYNDMVEGLEEESGTINTMYKKQLHNYVISYKSKLDKIGITEDKYGKLELDKQKLQETETENLKELFQGEGSFADKVNDRCEKVKDNAETNLNSLNSATYSSLLAGYGSSGGRFDFEA